MVIFCHGFTGSKEGQGKSLEMAAELGKHGWASMLFDFSGNGESQGEFIDISLTSQIEDLSAVVDYCSAQGFSPLVTLGRSFGGSTAICHAAGDPQIAAVCTWAAPANLTELFLNFTDGDLPAGEDEPVMMADAEGAVHLRKSFFTDLLKHDVCSRAALISPRPLLIMQGRKDDVVPPTDAELIYKCAGEPKELYWIDGGDHNFSEHYREAWGVVIKWLKNNFNY